LIERLSGKNSCDAATDYAQEIPTRVTAFMLGISAQGGDLFRKWIHDALEAGITDPEILPRKGTAVCRNRYDLECHWLLPVASRFHAEDPKRLVAEPRLIPTSVEEFLRAYAPVTMAGARVDQRNKDQRLPRCHFKKGEMVLLPFPAANHDPETFPMRIVSS